MTKENNVQKYQGDLIHTLIDAKLTELALADRPSLAKQQSTKDILHNEWIMGNTHSVYYENHEEYLTEVDKHDPFALLCSARILISAALKEDVNANFRFTVNNSWYTLLASRISISD